MFWSVWQVGSDPFVMLTSLLLIPVIGFWTARARFASSINCWLAVSTAVFYGFFVSYFFPWSLFSVYLRWLPLLALAIVSLAALRRPLADLTMQKKVIRRRRGWLTAGLALVILLDASLVKGMIPSASAVELAFPLKGGTFSVTEGGSSFWINYHYGDDAEFRYAIDIVQVDAFGRRAAGLLPARMQAYRVWGETVHSPCSGIVVMVHGGVADSPLFTKSIDEPYGNRVAVDCGGTLVLMDHLLIDSTIVLKNQQVSVGDPLAKVGSSGASTEPHLHIQANVYDGAVIGASLPITFNGRYLVRNALIKSAK